MERIFFGVKDSEKVYKQPRDVINLSQKLILNKNQETLLNKGLSFIPILKNKPIKNRTLQQEVQTYHRRLKLTSHFGPSSNQPLRKFLGKSNWEPPTPKIPRIVQDLIEEDRNTVKLTRTKPDSPNISEQEERELKFFLKEDSIIIKKADKGNSIVIMDKNDYKFEVYRQLNDTQYYKPLEQPIYKETAIKINEILQNMLEEGFLTNKQVTYLQGKTPARPRLFYLLPKIHKPKSEWTIPNKIPKGRPIISDCGSESYEIAEYLEYYLTPISTLHPSYIKDTPDFLDKLTKIKITEPSFLFTMDVANLYTNIDTTLGLKAVATKLKKYPADNRPDQYILKLLKLSLLRNDFEFEGKYFLQIKGTAMGKKFAPAYANIYMADWEDTILDKMKHNPLCYFRYLDDIFGVWTYSKEDFFEWVEILNDHHASIKLTPTIHPKEVNFLDVTIFKGPLQAGESRLDTKVFFKETDTHALLHKKSYHPKHVFKGIVKSQLMRFDRICTQEQDKGKAINILFKSLRKRGYSRSFLNNIKNNYKNQRTQENRNKRPLPIILTYSSLARRLSRKLKINFQTALTDSTIDKHYKIILAYRRNRNLKDILTRAKFETQKKEPKLPTTSIVKNRTTRKIFKIPFIPFKTCNCIYMIKCKKCGIQYVGETRNSISVRKSHHTYNIRHRNKSSTHLVQHFLSHGIQNLMFKGLEQDNNWTTAQRRRREYTWIQRLNTRFPHGLNEQIRKVRTR